nr:hypothetical protein pmam_268 [Pithovirus mammoth]
MKSEITRKMTDELFLYEELLLENFLNDNNKKYLLIYVGGSSYRRAIHEWAENNSCFSRSEYSVKTELTTVKCFHCRSILNCTSQDFIKGEESDPYFKCCECLETSAWCPSGGDDDYGWRKFPKATGHMIVMKGLIPGYKRLAPCGGTWKKKTRA